MTDRCSILENGVLVACIRRAIANGQTILVPAICQFFVYTVLGFMGESPRRPSSETVETQWRNVVLDEDGQPVVYRNSTFILIGSEYYILWT
jgi:hypothetical protein